MFIKMLSYFSFFDQFHAHQNDMCIFTVYHTPKVDYRFFQTRLCCNIFVRKLTLKESNERLSGKAVYNHFTQIQNFAFTQILSKIFRNSKENERNLCKQGQNRENQFSQNAIFLKFFWPRKKFPQKLVPSRYQNLTFSTIMNKTNKLNQGHYQCNTYVNIRRVYVILFWIIRITVCKYHSRVID